MKTNIEYIYLIAGIFGGGICSWIITYLYYSKSKKDNINSEVRLKKIIGEKAINQLKQSTFTQKDANRVIKEIWKFNTNKFGNDFMKYRCPNCGSSDICFPILTDINGYEADFILCNHCGNDEF